MHPTLVAAAVALVSAAAFAKPVPPEALAPLQWRHVGPFRGGRTKAAAGVPQRPGTFFVGAVNGGVWKTDDYGRTWTPIFDDQPTGSIGAIAVAPSNPDVLYVGSGEGLHRPDLSVGDGIYKSTDGGRTWRHLGLRDAQQITQIAVDPNDPNRLFVAALGHPYGPNVERGLFRSLDGGQSFEKVLYKGPDTGAADVVLDPKDARTVYAALWEHREGPWENAEFDGPGSGLYKSTDGGTTWKQIGRGLPDYPKDKVGRIGIGIAPSRPGRVFTTVDAKKNGGLYRSDDGGESFVKIAKDDRVVERASDFAEVKVHPENPDVVFTASVVMWKSVDGGKTFVALRGAPGGDDYHRIWIDPIRPDVMLVASDQGAVVTVNGGRTWSSWYNQPTAQMFHVTADNAFPYRLCGGQQESGSACVTSRGPTGQITFRDWSPAGVDEYGYAAPDPLDPDVVYGGRVSRFDRRTGQTQNVSPRPLRGEGYRVVRTQPTLFSKADPKALFTASNAVWKTTDGGRNWVQISPDLTRKTWDVPASVGKYRGTDQAKVSQRGVVYTIAPSPKDAKTIWAGTDDGLIHVTRDGGKRWTDVTPPELGPWAKVSLMDASQFDANTAYAAINPLRLDDLRPLILRTRDGGKSWQRIVEGIEGGPVNVVREDHKRRGLLFAGTEQAVFVSFDAGDHWQSLRQNMPATSIRDLIVKDSDVAVATHGRGFWILDDIAPLRQVRPSTLGLPVHLFAPSLATRARWNLNTDTPLPADEPAASNGPDGISLDYWLHDDARGPVTLEILDGAGRSVRTFSSEDELPEIRDEGNVPAPWIRPPRRPGAAKGMHRFVWDLRHALPKGTPAGYPIAAVPRNTVKEPRGPWVLPGKYTVRLTASGETRTEPLVVRMDPRVKAPIQALRRQHELSMRVVGALDAHLVAQRELETLRKAAPKAKALAALEGVEDDEEEDQAPPKTPPPPTFKKVAGRLVFLLGRLQDADAAPTSAMIAAVGEVLKEAADLRERFARAKAEATR